MSIKGKLMDAVIAGFGAAAGSELFRDASKAVAKHALKKGLGDSDDEDGAEEVEAPAPAKTDPKAAERARKQAEKDAKRAAEVKKRAAQKVEKEIDDELAALKKKLKSRG